MPTIIITSGIPCSGKSTWTEKQKGWLVLSRDKIRLEWNKGKYVFDSAIEHLVTNKFNTLLKEAFYNNEDVICDNTFCKQKYITDILKEVPSHYNIEIKKFPVNLYIAHIRNIWRWKITGKWIPFKVMKDMNKNFNNLWKGIYGLPQIHTGDIKIL